MATLALGYVKDYLIKELGEKLKQGIDPLFVQITTTLKGNQGLQTILKPICFVGKIDDVKNELITQTQKDEFYVELQEKIPDITDDMRDDLKTKIKKLIEDVITCNAAPAPAAVAGGSKQRDRKQKRRQKTKKRINKRSRGRKRHSRK